MKVRTDFELTWNESVKLHTCGDPNKMLFVGTTGAN